ncbi:GNAT family N-acetyltransferase [Sphingomonas lenta]|uniref:GNAT family N-acetyltransferase n=1 Tax=Sphingomonas lenta TaxID=1141887 RepID=A0A2A2SIP6_9SPHN|nr:GNAT family N-acetyltransferase [Sphingomonas lenta]
MIRTERLLIRPWRDEDLDPFAAMSADPEVMRHLDGVVDRAHAADVIARQRAVQAEQGHCFWALERRGDGAFLGFCGLRVGGHPGTPVERELEIGWRLARPAWKQGYAREAAEACLDWAWRHTQAPRVAAWTVPANVASWTLMARLGMVHRPELDFDHPRFEAGHPLRRHLVHTIARPA